MNTVQLFKKWFTYIFQLCWARAKLEIELTRVQTLLERTRVNKSAWELRPDGRESWREFTLFERARESIRLFESWGQTRARVDESSYFFDRAQEWELTRVQTLWERTGVNESVREMRRNESECSNFSDTNENLSGFKLSKSAKSHW